MDSIDPPEFAARPPLIGVLTLRVTPPPSLPVEVFDPLPRDMVPARGLGASTFGLAPRPVIVAARDRFRMKLGRKELRGDVGEAMGAGAGLPPGVFSGEPLGDRPKGVEGSAM
jgi:hypothetical protein